MKEWLDELYRRESRRIFATLVRLLGDFELAEEALHDAFAIALERWTREGRPANPVSWLISAGRFRAIDGLRRSARFDASLRDLVLAQAERDARNQQQTQLDDEWEDDRLRLIFTCCHPALAPETRVALTLREVCGLRTEEVADAFLIAPTTMAQRLVRAKAKIRDARIPYQVPAREQLSERLDSVLAVIYLVYNEGYAASRGPSLTRRDLSEEAIRLGRLLVSLLPDSEALGLLSLMLLQESRRGARCDARGDLVLLEDQDRGLWDRAKIAEGLSWLQSARRDGTWGLYNIQASIAALHAVAPSVAETNWAAVVQLYDLLTTLGSPVVELNRAVAIAMRDGVEAGLQHVDAILARGELHNYHLAYATRADLLRRLQRYPEARVAYLRAFELTHQDAERRFLQRRLENLEEDSVDL